MDRSLGLLLAELLVGREMIIWQIDLNSEFKEKSLMIFRRKPKKDMLTQIEDMKDEADVIGLLCAKSSSLNYEENIAASEALDELQGPGIVPELVLALQEPSAEVRAQAVNRLGEIQDMRAIEPIIAALADQDPDVRRCAADHIGTFGDRHAVQPLIGLLDDEDYLIRTLAAKSLGELGDPQAVQPMIPLLKDSNEYVIIYTAAALGQIGDQRAVEPLREALREMGIGATPTRSDMDALDELGH